LGLGSPDPVQNPIHSGACPFLEEWLRTVAVPLDAAMGVAGLPQSATGQTALLTGVNAAAQIGRHVEGFPGPALREIVRRHNLYDQLAALGLRSTFANAYYVTDIADVESRKIQSVTTVAALQAHGRVRALPDMLANNAVYQDLTRVSLRERGYDGPLVTPAESAQHLTAIANAHDFTLFEYFQTDRVGHRGSRDDVIRVLAMLDAFLRELGRFMADPRNLLILTSDHGNIEEGGTSSHSAHPVPLVAVGRGADFIQAHVKEITDVTPAIVALYRQFPPGAAPAPVNPTGTPSR
jgi:2,3-bisphosphoglycerate-independent phosphoglycerate mutase